MPVRLDTLQLDLGLVGPAAGGEFVQNNFHRLIGVATRPTAGPTSCTTSRRIGLTFERRWRTGARRGVRRSQARVRLRAAHGGSLGNVETYASAGGMLAHRQGAAGRFRPAARAAGLARIGRLHRRGFGWYLFAGADGEAVARNMFLDGNTDGNSIVHVTHRPFVGEAQAGLALLFSGVRISYTQVLRTPEFFERDRWDQFGSINVTFRY